MSKRTLVAIGKVVKPLGIRGDVVILPMTGNLARFKKLKSVFVGRNDADTIEVTVGSVVVERRGVRLRLGAASDRTAAEKLVGSLLFVHEKDAIRLPKDTFFVHDIVGLNVIDEDGEPVGIVKDVLKYPANDVYVIENKGNEVLLPAVKEFIRKIDIETKTMRVKLIGGMFDDETDDAKDNDAD